MLTISTDPSSESVKMDSLLRGAFPLLSDPDLKVADAYGMGVHFGRETMAAMGYVIIDGQGRLRQREIDPLFGDHYERILAALKGLAP